MPGDVLDGIDPEAVRRIGQVAAEAVQVLRNNGLPAGRSDSGAAGGCGGGAGTGDAAGLAEGSGARLAELSGAGVGDAAEPGATSMAVGSGNPTGPGR